MVLAWVVSYLSDRAQCVSIGDSRSHTQQLLRGIPHGSVLGPIFFTIYTQPLGDIMRHHNMNYHLYADDTQLYITFNGGDTSSKLAAISQIELCAVEVKEWMLRNIYVKTQQGQNWVSQVSNQPSQAL